MSLAGIPKQAEIIRFEIPQLPQWCKTLLVPYTKLFDGLQTSPPLTTTSLAAATVPVPAELPWISSDVWWYIWTLLPVQTLLIARAVCRDWHTSIDKMLQQA